MDKKPVKIVLSKDHLYKTLTFAKVELTLKDLKISDKKEFPYLNQLFTYFGAFVKGEIEVVNP